MRNNNNMNCAIEIHREHHAVAMGSPLLVKRYCTPRNKVISALGAGIRAVGGEAPLPVPEGAAKFGDYLGLS